MKRFDDLLAVASAILAVTVGRTFVKGLGQAVGCRLIATPKT